MKNISYSQQFRHVTGEYLARQDRITGDARQQQDRITVLANHPGRNSTNASQQDLAYSILNLVTLLNTVQPDPASNIPSGIENKTGLNVYGARPSPLSGNEVAKSISIPTLVNSDSLMLIQEITGEHQVLHRPPRNAPPSGQPSKNNSEKNLAHEQVIKKKEPEPLEDIQNKIIDAWLLENNLRPYGNHKFDRVNTLTQYMVEDINERVTEIARLLLSASNSYGALEGERVSDANQWAAIAEYFHQTILGMALDTWLFKQIQQIKTHENHLYHHENLKRAFTNMLNRVEGSTSLSPGAQKFYQQYILSNLLPTFMLQLNPQAQTELDQMDISKTQWGFIHAGARLLNYAGNEFRTLNLEELAEVGITLDILLRQGVIPQKYVDFFYLPALFYQASRAQHPLVKNELTHHKMTQIIKHYFEHTASWIKQHDPITHLSDLVKNWKTRPELAREILAEKKVPLTLLNSVLNKRKTTIYHYANGESITIPDINEVFSLQNQKIEKVASEADKLILAEVFNKLSQASQEFIETAQVNRVSARFSAAKVIKGIPVSKSVKMGIDNSGALEYLIPDRYDLLQCINNNEERIYVLQTKKDGAYSLFHANTLRDDMFMLLDNIPPGGIADYELKIGFNSKLKNKDDPPSKIIHEIATLHSARLRLALDQQGYQKTHDEKVKDFLLSLVPFYTCITEAIKGDANAAVPACLIDVLSLLPFTGAAAKTGLHFGTSLAKTTALALAWGSRQAALKSMLKQAGNTFINNFPDVAIAISPQVLEKLGVSFLRGIDPGVELVTQGMLKGTIALERAISNIHEKGRGLTDLGKNLRKLISTPLPVLEPKNYPTRTLFSKWHNREVELAAIGKQNSRKVWVQINSETGELFGRKYFINAQDTLILAPSAVTTRLKAVRTEGLGGKGAIRKVWPNDKQSAGPSSENRNALPTFRNDVIANIPVKIWRFGEPGSETLLYPEVNRIVLRTEPIDIKKYDQAISTLLPEQQTALLSWMTPGSPTLLHEDGTIEIVSNLSIELNNKLIRGLPLTPHEQATYENLLNAIASKKIPSVQGDYLHVSHYRSDTPNPWLKDELAVNDYVTNYPMLMSFSSEPEFAVAALKEAATFSSGIESFIFYKVENAKNIFPMISSSFSLPQMENDFIYPPKTIFKIKSISISRPTLPENIADDKNFFRVNRIGVILTEVDATELTQVTTLKNIFNGIKSDFSPPRPVLPPYNHLPALPINRAYWDDVRKIITAPMIPPPSSVSYTQLQKLDKFIPEIPLQVAEDTQIVTLKNEEHVHKFLSNHNWRAYAGLSGDVPPEIAWIQGIVRLHCEESLRKIINVDNILSNTPAEELMNTYAGKYIMGLTPTKDYNIINEVFQRLSKAFKRARVFMEAAKDTDYSNFIIVSTDLAPGPSNRQRYISLLTDEELRYLPKACTHKFDPESRIIIFADQFIGNSPDNEGIRLSLQSKSEFKIHQTIIHELTHLSSLSSDLFSHSIPARDAEYSALFARYNYMRSLMPGDTPQRTAPIWEKTDFVKFMQNVVNYQNVVTRLDYASVIVSIRKDPMLSANIFYSDAEVLALIANDIDAKRNFDAEFRSKRDTAEKNNTIGNNIDTLSIISLLLDATTPGLIHPDEDNTVIHKIRVPLRAINEKKIAGVTMSLQIYGETNNAALLFPEHTKWENQKVSFTKKSQNSIIATLSANEKKELTLWTEFADQHQAIKTPIAKDKINTKLIKGVDLTPTEKTTYNYLMRVINEGKLPGVPGDYLRVVHYTNGEKNPWLNDELDVNDYLTTSKAFMSACASDRFALSEIMDIANPEKNITSIVLYNIEKGNRAMPVLPLPHAPLNMNDEYLYPPNSLFKVKSLAIAVPGLIEAGYNDSALYRAHRVAVTLTEVSAEEAKRVMTVKNIFDGTTTHFLN